ncbi:WD40 repeat domain-containing protein, partial [Peptoniphilus asaccharolyticus]
DKSGVQAIVQQLSDKASKTDIKTKLSELADDSTHRLVTDSEKDSWNKKQNKLSAGTNVEITSGNRINVNIPKVEVVNDLTTGGTTKALSAEQGKVLFQNVDNGKRLIANAIIDKGQNGVTKDSTFNELAIKIKNIKTGYSVGDVIKENDLKVIKTLTPNKIWEFTGHSGHVRAIAVDNNGNIYSGSSDKKVMKISPSGNKIWEFTEHYNWVRAIAVDNNGNIYSGSDDKKLMKISPSGNKIWEFTGHSGWVIALAVDTQGNIYSGSGDNKVMKISPSRNKIWEFTGNNSLVNSVAVDSNGNVYSGSDDKKVMKISPSGTKIWEFTGHSGWVIALAVDTQGNIYSGSGDNKVMKISPSRNKIWEFTGHSDWVNALAVDTQGNIYSGSSDNKVMKIEEITNVTGYEVLK